jgi:putative membrane protein
LRYRGGVDIFPGRYGGDGGLFWIHDLFWLLIIVALVIGTFLVVRAVIARPTGPRPDGAWPVPSAALHELDLRYARGELDRADYLQRRADLLGHPGKDAAPPSTPTTPTSPSTS